MAACRRIGRSASHYRGFNTLAPEAEISGKMEPPSLLHPPLRDNFPQPARFPQNFGATLAERREGVGFAFVFPLFREGRRASRKIEHGQNRLPRLVEQFRAGHGVEFRAARADQQAHGDDLGRCRIGGGDQLAVILPQRALAPRGRRACASRIRSSPPSLRSGFSAPGDIPAPARPSAANGRHRSQSWPRKARAMAGAPWRSHCGSTRLAT